MIKWFLKNKYKKHRYWLLNKLFNDDEKYLLKIAIDTRVKTLEIHTVNDRCADKYFNTSDIYIYNKLNRDIFEE